MQVLICDDQEPRCAEVQNAIDGSGTPDLKITTLVGKQLTERLVQLFKAVKPTLEGKAGGMALAGSPFTSADLILIDNNLAHLEIEGARLTAESIAGYVRTASTAYIVSLNKNPEIDFDLRYLIGDYSTRADIALKTGHLASRALWSGLVHAKPGEFLPWYWPTLCEAPERRRGQIRWLTNKLDNTIASTFSFSELSIESLSRHARGVIAPEAKPGEDDVADWPALNDVTFKSFLATSNRSLPLSEDRSELSKTAEGTSVEYNVLAADLDWWFRRDVIGPQETLVDVPHLLMRMPFLLGDGAGDVAKWRAAAAATSEPYGIVPELYDRHLKPYLFAEGAWASRPVFWWSHLRENNELNKLFSKSEQQWPDLVFCEDVSDFCPRESAGGAPREFVAEFDSPWDRRYVKSVPSFKYVPRSRFAV